MAGGQCPKQVSWPYVVTQSQSVLEQLSLLLNENANRCGNSVGSAVPKSLARNVISDWGVPREIKGT